MVDMEDGQIEDEQVPNREEVRQVYIQLFEEAGVTSTWKWEDFHRLMRDDSRYHLIKAIAQKKQIFLDHIQTLKKRDREEARQKKQLAKENFMKMLDSSAILRADSKFYKTAHFFQGDPRWRILEDKERVELFQDFLDELERRDRDKQRQQREKLMQQLRRAIDDNSEITHTTKWAHLQSALADNPVFIALDKLDQLNVFKDFVTETEKRVYEAKELEESTTARKNRENFRALLSDCIAKGELNAASHWKDFFPRIRQTPQYKALVGQPGSTPKDLFDEAVESEGDKIQDLVSVLRSVLKIGEHTRFEDVKAQVESVITEDVDKEVVFTVLSNEVRDIEREKRRKFRKCERRFEEFLRSHPKIGPGSILEDIAGEIESNKHRFSKLRSSDRDRIFNEVVDRIHEESQSDLEPGEIKSKSKKGDKKEKKLKKHKKDDPYRESKKHKKKSKHRSPDRS